MHTRHTVLLLILVLAPVLDAAQAEPTAIFLVRHAEKATGGDAKDPDLSEAGRARAANLAAMLKDAHFAAIYATEFKRTQQTAAPVAHVVSVQPTIIPAKETAVLVTKVKEASGNVLIVGHSNTLPEIIKALGVEAPPGLDETDYDNLFVLTPGSPAQLLRLHFR